MLEWDKLNMATHGYVVEDDLPPMPADEDFLLDFDTGPRTKQTPTGNDSAARDQQFKSHNAKQHSITGAEVHNAKAQESSGQQIQSDVCGETDLKMEASSCQIGS